MSRKHAKLKNGIIRYCKRILDTKNKYVILDTETTGLGKNDVILQIGLIDLDGKILMDSLIRPTKRKRISKEAVNIHGISMKSVEHAPSFAEICFEFERIINNREILIYNAPFDVRLLDQTCAQDDCTLKANHEVTCVMDLYSKFIGKWDEYHREYKWQKLPGSDHSAVGDCLATLNVIKKMAASDEAILPKRWWHQLFK